MNITTNMRNLQQRTSRIFLARHIIKGPNGISFEQNNARQAIVYQKKDEAVVNKVFTTWQDMESQTPNKSTSQK